MNRKPLRDDWFTFGVRFFFGSLLGLLVGWLLWVRVVDNSSGWWFVAATAMLLGFAAAYWGDAFWESLRGWFFWWLP